MQGSCKEGDAKNQLAVTVAVGVELTRGPAMQGRVTSAGVRRRDRRRYDPRQARLPDARVFPSNVDRITLTPGEANLTLPVTPTKSGAAYTILAGFQLTPDQTARTPQTGSP